MISYVHRRSCSSFSFDSYGRDSKMIKKILEIYISGFTLILITSILCLPDAKLFTILSFLIISVMGLIIEFMNKPIRNYIVSCVVVLFIVVLGAYAMYQTSSYETIKGVYIMVVPLLLVTHRKLKNSDE